MRIDRPIERWLIGGATATLICVSFGTGRIASAQETSSEDEFTALQSVVRACCVMILDQSKRVQALESAVETLGNSAIDAEMEERVCKLEKSLAAEQKLSAERYRKYGELCRKVGVPVAGK